MSTNNVTCFEKFDGVNVLLKLRGTANERLNMTVLFALAYLIDEKNNHLIVSTNGKPNVLLASMLISSPSYYMANLVMCSLTD